MERVECTGKCYYVLALALFQFIECGMLLLIILKCKVEGFLAYVLLDLTLVMLFLPVIYFLLFFIDLIDGNLLISPRKCL